MQMHRIAWWIDIEANSPREAAEAARAIQLRPDSIANVFDVYPQRDGGKITIDLSEEGGLQR